MRRLPALLLLLFTSVANAAILTVDTALDVVNPGDGVLSLREALADAMAGDEIQFDASLNGQTIVLGGTQLEVDKNLTITGPGAALLAVDGNALNRVLLIETGISATISGLTFQNGDTSGIAFGDDSGAGINNRGTLDISDCVITDNQGPGNLVGAGIISSQSLVMTRCEVSDNIGEGIRAQAGPVTIVDSTVSGSTAIGLVVASGSNTLRIRGSTFSGNQGNVGGAINNSSISGPIVIENSTFSGNSATNFGGAIWAGSAPLTLFNTTVTNNDAVSEGGGISRATGATVTLHNSIVAGNIAPAEADCAINGAAGGSWVTDDHNLFGVGTGCPVGASDLTTADASSVLEPLADNGGETRTHALDPVPNVARDAGNPDGCLDENGSLLLQDQRGGPRYLGRGCDIGAYEAVSPVPALSFPGALLLAAALVAWGRARPARASA